MSKEMYADGIEMQLILEGIKVKKKLITITLLLTTFLFTACGSSSGYATKSAGPEMMVNDMASGSYYGNTNITGDKVDYSYNFTASGKTNKSKQDMLNDYESIQSYVDSQGGYIENVYNNYDVYEEDDNYYYGSDRLKYRARGQLEFTAQIDNALVPDLIEKLETMCKANNLIVTNYSQQIQNYKEYKVTDEPSEEYETITSDELKQRLAYAEVRVNMVYNIPRPFIITATLTVKTILIDLIEGIPSIIKVVFCLIIGIFIIYLQIVLLYKMFMAMKYRHKLDHPEYYPPKEITIAKQDDLEV